MSYTVAQLTTIGGRQWKEGELNRVYINDWQAQVGLEVEFFKSGNVNKAWLNDKPLTKREARSLLLGKVFYDINAQCWGCKDVSADVFVDVVAKLEAKLTPEPEEEPTERDTWKLVILKHMTPGDVSVWNEFDTEEEAREAWRYLMANELGGVFCAAGRWALLAPGETGQDYLKKLGQSVVV